MSPSGRSTAAARRRAFFQQTFAGFPDLRFELGSVVADGERGAAEWTMSGAHAGAFPGLPATQKRFSARRECLRAGDKLRRNSDYWNFASVLGQLGLMPAPSEAPVSA